MRVRSVWWDRLSILFLDDPVFWSNLLGSTLLLWWGICQLIIINFKKFSDTTGTYKAPFVSVQRVFRQSNTVPKEKYWFIKDNILLQAVYSVTIPKRILLACVGFYIVIVPCRIIHKDSFGFRIPSTGFQIPCIGISVELEFRIPIVSGILASWSSIPDSKAQNSGYTSKNWPHSGEIVNNYLDIFYHVLGQLPTNLKQSLSKPPWRTMGMSRGWYQRLPRVPVK